MEVFDSHGDRAVVGEEVATEAWLNSRDGHRTRARRVLVALLMALTAAVLVLPVWAVKYPPLLDYPNHLASSYVLAHLHDSLPFHLWYAAEWGPYPYVAMEVILRALQLVVPAEVAGRLYLTFAVLALPAAMWFFLRQSNPGQGAIACWALVGTHNIFFLLGYLNFYVGLAVGFLALGLWLRWRAPVTVLMAARHAGLHRDIFLPFDCLRRRWHRSYGLLHFCATVCPLTAADLAHVLAGCVLLPVFRPNHGKTTQRVRVSGLVGEGRQHARHDARIFRRIGCRYAGRVMRLLPVRVVPQ